MTFRLGRTRRPTRTPPSFSTRSRAERHAHVITIDYDDQSFVPSRVADELGTRFRFTNNDHGLPLDVEDAEGHVAHLEYDAAGNVITRRDWLGRTTRATYDED